MKKDIQIDAGLKEDKRTVFLKNFYDAVNEFNKNNPEEALDIMVLSSNSQGGTSFLIGEVDPIIREIQEVSLGNPGFSEFIHKLKVWY